MTMTILYLKIKYKNVQSKYTYKMKIIQNFHRGRKGGSYKYLYPIFK